MKKVIVLGASGIIGQHMRLREPGDVEALYCRREEHEDFCCFDATQSTKLLPFLSRQKPDVVVNLAGESRVDVVEKEPGKYEGINVELPYNLAAFCERDNIQYIHISTQGVFHGDKPPYSASDEPNAVNEYGWQKSLAEELVRRKNPNAVIVRPTFVLGVRPDQNMGRQNPIEQMLAGGEQNQVDDRFFSVADVHEVAEFLWNCAVNPIDIDTQIMHVGNPISISRFQLALMVTQVHPRMVQAVSHSYFKGIAERPKDTSYDVDSEFKGTIDQIIGNCVADYAKYVGEKVNG
jgi:dTDP-4-dehydrorhamnose reductase